MTDRAEVRMTRHRFRQYLGWLGASWDLKDHDQIAFAYFALRRDGFSGGDASILAPDRWRRE